MLRLLSIAAVCAVLAPSAVAKDFRPGDLRVCGRDHCVPITNRHLLRILSSYYYGSGRAPRAARVPRGAPGFELRFKNGYASGMIATKKLDRFQAYGFYCGRFERGSDAASLLPTYRAVGGSPLSARETVPSRLDR